MYVHIPKAPWDVMGCTCSKAPGVSLGGSGVSIGGVAIFEQDLSVFQAGNMFPPAVF